MDEHVSKRWVPFRIVVVATFALAFGLAPLHATKATNNESTAQQGADLEELLCQTAGGDTTTTSVVDAQGNTNATSVQCQGGLLDGMNCTNLENATDCEMGLTQPPRLPGGAVRVPGPVVARPALATPAPPTASNATPIVKPPAGG